jgi:hypothetical protein
VQVAVLGGGAEERVSGGQLVGRFDPQAVRPEGVPLTITDTIDEKSAMKKKLRQPPTPPDDRPMLLGRLRLCRYRVTGATYLRIDVWCPCCRVQHTHGFTQGLDECEHRTAHCRDSSPFRDGGYYIAVDPAHDAESVELLRKVRPV